MGGGIKPKEPEAPKLKNYQLTPIQSFSANETSVSSTLYRNELIAVGQIRKSPDGKIDIAAYRTNSIAARKIVTDRSTMGIPDGFNVQFDPAASSFSFIDKPYRAFYEDADYIWVNTDEIFDIKNSPSSPSYPQSRTIEKRRRSDGATIKSFSFTAYPEDLKSAFRNTSHVPFIGPDESFYIANVTSLGPVVRKYRLSSNSASKILEFDLSNRFKSAGLTNINANEFDFGYLRSIDPERILFNVNKMKYIDGQAHGMVGYTIAIDLAFAEQRASASNATYYKDREQFEGAGNVRWYPDADMLYYRGFANRPSGKFYIFIQQGRGDGIARLIVLKESRFRNTTKNSGNVLKDFWDKNFIDCESLLEENEYILPIGNTAPAKTKIMISSNTGRYAERYVIDTHGGRLSPSELKIQESADILFAEPVYLQRVHDELRSSTGLPTISHESHIMIYRKNSAGQFILDRANAANIGVEFGPLDEYPMNQSEPYPAPFATLLDGDKYYLFDNRTQKFVVFRVDLE